MEVTGKNRTNQSKLERLNIDYDFSCVISTLSYKYSVRPHVYTVWNARVNLAQKHEYSNIKREYAGLEILIWRQKQPPYAGKNSCYFKY